MVKIERGMFTARPEIKGTFGVASSTHWLASATAMGVLERGGNAFDAAAAGGFVLQVVEPHLNGPGGEVPILVYDQRDARIEVICGQGVVPAAATPQRFRGLGLDLVPGTGLLPGCVPGAFGGWLMMLRDHGTWAVADILAPAIAYAEQGYPLVARITNALANVAALFRNEWPSSAEIYVGQSDLPKPGDLFRNPALAATYRRIIAEAEAAGGDRERQIEAARRSWYQGFVAEAVDRFYRHRRTHGFDWRAPQRAAERRRHGPLGGDPRSTSHLRLSRAYRGQMRPLEPRARPSAAIGLAARLCARRHGGRRAGFRPRRGRGGKARLRRPRGLVRRCRWLCPCREDPVV
jgi:hypothetical protein